MHTYVCVCACVCVFVCERLCIHINILPKAINSFKKLWLQLELLMLATACLTGMSICNRICKAVQKKSHLQSSFNLDAYKGWAVADCLYIDQDDKMETETWLLNTNTALNLRNLLVLLNCQEFPSFIDCRSTAWVRKTCQESDTLQSHLEKQDRTDNTQENRESRWLDWVAATKIWTLWPPPEPVLCIMPVHTCRQTLKT